MILRKIALYLNYWRYKILYRDILDIQGMSIIFHDKSSSINFNLENKGMRIHLLSDTFSNMLGISHRCILVARHGGRIIIGENTGLSGSTVYSMESIKIGKNVLVGASCKIIDNDFHPLRPELRVPYDPNTIKKAPVEIGDGCFIGTNSIILKGTKLGKNCVVGAGSVVHGSWPDNSIIAGNPAKFIKQNI